MRKFNLFIIALCSAILGYGQVSSEQELKVESKKFGEKGDIKYVQFKKDASLSNERSEYFLKVYLGAGEGDNFKKIKSEKGKLGYLHESFQQYKGDIPVEFGIYKVHSYDGQIVSMNGSFFPTEELQSEPKLSKEEGLSFAIKSIGAEHYLWEDVKAAMEMDNYEKPEGTLVILPASVIDKNKERKAYKYDIYATQPLSRGYVYIDADTGEMLLYNAIIKHANHFGHVGTLEHPDHSLFDESNKTLQGILSTASAETRYSGTLNLTTKRTSQGYILADDGKRIYTRNANNRSANGASYVSNYTEFRDNDNNWTYSEHYRNKDNAALDAHWGATKTFDYFYNVHNRNSYDGNGAQIRSYVHVGSDYDNAFWNGAVMSYGDGSSNGQEGNGYFDALTSLDVAAHEIGHAVCSHTANLVYQKEPGALNEGFSDIWGAVVEYYAAPNDPNKDRWLLGEEIDRRTGSAGLRSMRNPKLLRQPDTYGGRYWVSQNCSPNRNNDLCGVHTNSGVLNHWFYILTEGKSGTNDKGDTYSVTGIGIDKAADIAYRTESVYLTSTSNYSDAREASIQSAKDLYGAGSSEVVAVTNAWYAVGVGEAAVSDGGDDGDTPGSGDCVSGAVKLSIIFDRYAEETSYELKDANGSIVSSKAFSQSDRGTTYSTTFDNLSPGNYTFVIKDRYGDGICCTYGNGSYTLSSDNVVIKTGGDFKRSESVSFCVSSNGPSTPTDLKASDITTNSVRLSWKASRGDIKEYEVFKNNVSLGKINKTTATISGLSPLTTYYFKVKAYDNSGRESDMSEAIRVTTQEEVNDSGCYNDEIHLSLTFDRYPRETYWKLFDDGGNVLASKYYTSSTASYSTVSYKINGLSAGSYVLKVYDRYGDGMCCTYGRGSYTLSSGNEVIKKGGDFKSYEATEFCFNGSNSVFNGIVDDEKEALKGTFTVSPNPAKEYVKLTLVDGKPGAVYEVYDVSGNLIYSGNLETSNEINVSQLKSGVYVVKVKNGNETFTEKLIIE